MADAQTRRRHRSPGYTIPEVAAELGWPEKTVRKGVEKGDVKVVDFAGMRRITAAEVARLKALFPDTAA